MSNLPTYNPFEILLRAVLKSRYSSVDGQITRAAGVGVGGGGGDLSFSSPCLKGRPQRKLGDD